MNPDAETGGPRVYTRSDGTPGASYEVTAITVKFLGGRGEASTFGAPSDEDVPPEGDMDEDAIPF